jgi:hypothetical protein
MVKVLAWMDRGEMTERVQQERGGLRVKVLSVHAIKVQNRSV